MSLILWGLCVPGTARTHVGTVGAVTSPQQRRGQCGGAAPSGCLILGQDPFPVGKYWDWDRDQPPGIALFGLTGCHGPAHGLGICRRPARAAPLPQGGRHEGNRALWDMGTCVGTGPCVGNGAVWDLGMCRATGPCVGYGALCGVRGPLWGNGPFVGYGAVQCHTRGYTR